MIKNLIVFISAFILGVLLAGAAGFYSAAPIEISEGPCAVEKPATEPLSAADFPEEINEKKTPPRFYLAGASDEEVKEVYLKLRKAVAANDKEAAASLMNYPLKVHFPDDPPGKKISSIKDRRSFIRVFDRIFDQKLKDFISRIDVENGDEFIIRSDGIGTNQGEFWINVYCTDSQCKDPQKYVKIDRIYGVV